MNTVWRAITAASLIALAGLTRAQPGPVEPAPDGPAPNEPASEPDRIPIAPGPRSIEDIIRDELGAAEETDRRDAVSPAVRALVDAEYLTDTERADLRIRHGLFTPADLEDPVRLAAAALIVGDWANPVLKDDATPRLMRAEAALERGDAEGALELIAGDNSPHAIRVRAQALFDLGRYAEALAATDPLLHMLETTRPETTVDAAETVRALSLRARLREGNAEADYSVLLALLADARERVDRLDPIVREAEAELLYEKHNRPEAAAAAQEALTLNPLSRRALRILGELSVDGFDFDQAEAIAGRLDHGVDELGPLGEHAAPEAHSVDALLILARARLRQRDPDAATVHTTAVLRRFPDQREALAMHAAAAAIAFDDEQRDLVLARLNQIAPDTAIGVYAVGAALSEARQYPEAAAYLTLATHRLPAWADPWLQLGLLQIQAGHDDDAREALERAVELDPFNMRANNSLTLLNMLASHESIESEHFIVRYKPGPDGMLAREMLPVLERIHDRVTGNGPGGIDHEPEQRTLIELMPDHETFAVRISGMPSLHTMAAATGPVIAMEAPREGAGQSVGQYDWPRTVQHEYTHTVTLSRTHNRIPHWFTEAAAVYLEDSPRDASTWKLLARAYEADALFDLRDINTAFVRPKNPTDRGQAYAQGHWMYAFIIERFGPRAPLQLMDCYADGLTEEEAFADVLGLSGEEFLAEFKPWAEADLRRAGMLPPEGSPNVRTLLDRVRAERGLTEDESLQPTPELVEQWLTEYPDHPDLHAMRIGFLLRDRGGSPNAEMVDALEAFARVRPVDDLPHRLLAGFYLASDDKDVRTKAIEHLVWLDEREQRSASFAAELSRMYAARDQLELATTYAERTVTLAPFDADYREFAARVAITAGDLEAAERHIHALTVIEPHAPLHRRRLERIRAMRAAR